MISVVIETHNHEDALARTLASLVSAAVEGVVREVIVTDAGSTDQTHSVADHAGCRFCNGGDLAAAIRQARAEWLVFLEPGARVGEDWTNAVVEHAGSSTGAARFRTGRAALVGRIFKARRPLAEGLMITRRQALALVQKADSAAAIARGVSSRRLDCTITPAPR